ncbi:MAG: phosphoenolpyruvate--protein phosphotransferase [Candidatus Sumerlaeota bacterium]
MANKKTSSKHPHHVFHGVPASAGFGHGPAYIHDSHRAPVERREIAEEKIEEEIERFDRAVAETREQLRKTQKMVSSKIDKAHAAIFEAQEVLLDDPLLIQACRREIRSQKMNAEFVLQQIVEQIRTLFEEIEAPNLSSQNLDVLDVTSRLRENLQPQETTQIEKLTRDCIIVAHDLRPSDTARLNARHVLGIVTEAGGPTSHSAILAKALNIPAVVGIEGLLKHVGQGDELLLDGKSGTVTVNPTKQDVERFETHLQELEEERETLRQFRDLPCETTDGYAMELLANLELPSEVANVPGSGAQGIGLFRSEFFYIGRGYIPPEEEQYQVYRDVAEEVAPQPVTCRTLDLGGDKFLSQPGVEDNGLSTFLGLRAIRLCLANPDIFRSQLRAILRASAFGSIKVMFPFITDISEVRRAKKILENVKSELKQENIDFDPDIQVGIMIETPAAALTAEVLASEVDFFSIGTNDLIQYTMAVDRVNESVADLYNPLHSAVINLIRRTIDAGHKAGITVSLCGEMGADPVLATLLMGLGIDELSMSAVAIPPVKRFIRGLSLADVRQLRQDVMSQLETGDTSKVVERFRRKHMKKTLAAGKTA